MKNFHCTIFLLLIFFLISVTAFPQLGQYVSPTSPPAKLKAPGMRVKLINSSDSNKAYVVAFSPGDEVRSGLTAFAEEYKITAAYYTGIGDALSVKMGWYDYQRKMFKVILVDSIEVTSLIGNITLFEDKPVAHSHITVSGEDGSVRGGHLLELIVGPTIEIFVTVIPTCIHKKLDNRFDAAVIE